MVDLKSRRINLATSLRSVLDRSSSLIRDHFWAPPTVRNWQAAGIPRLG
jgi:hypothetical protein